MNFNITEMIQHKIPNCEGWCSGALNKNTDCLKMEAHQNSQKKLVALQKDKIKQTQKTVAMVPCTTYVAIDLFVTHIASQNCKEKLFSASTIYLDHFKLAK